MLPTIIAMAGIKGGTGKTMTTVNLAVAAERQGVRTVILDLDPIEISAKWSDGRAEEWPKVHAASNVNLDTAERVRAWLPAKIAEAGRDGAQLVLIDTPGHAEHIVKPAIDAADLVLIPSRPLNPEILALMETVTLVATAGKIGSIVFVAVPFRAPELATARSFAESLNLPFAPAFLSDFRPYFRAFAASQGVTEYEPSGGAAAEVNALWEWITRHVEISQPKGRAAAKARAVAG